MERPRPAAASTSEVLAALIASRASTSSSRSAKRSKNNEISPSVALLSAENAATASSTAADARACSSAGTCSNVPVDGSTINRSPARKTAARSAPTFTTRSPPNTIGCPGVSAVSARLPSLTSPTSIGALMTIERTLAWWPPPTTPGSTTACTSARCCRAASSPPTTRSRRRWSTSSMPSATGPPASASWSTLPTTRSNWSTS